MPHQRAYRNTPLRPQRLPLRSLAVWGAREPPRPAASCVTDRQEGKGGEARTLISKLRPVQDRNQRPGKGSWSPPLFRWLGGGVGTIPEPQLMKPVLGGLGSQAGERTAEHQQERACKRVCSEL